MLVLTRKQQQSIVVGSTSGFEQLLKITVIESRAGKVRLGFEEAPTWLSIARKCGSEFRRTSDNSRERSC